MRMQGTDLPLYGMEIDVAAAAEEIRSIGKESDGSQVDLPAQPLPKSRMSVGKSCYRGCPPLAVLRWLVEGMASAAMPHGTPAVACEPANCDLSTSLWIKNEAGSLCE